MAVELAALEVPIRAPGTDSVLGALRTVERVGQQTNETLEQSQRAVTESWVRLGRQADEFTASAEAQAGTFSGKLQPALEAYKQSIREIQNDLGRARITIQQANESAAAAAVVYRQQAAAIRTASTANRAAAGTTAILTGQSIRAATGVRTLTRVLATQAAASIGVRAGLGSVVSTLGALSLGALTSLGVIAAFAAIAKGFQVIRDRAREAREEQEKFREDLDRLRRETEPELLTARRDVQETTKALRDQETANRDLTRSLAEATRERERAEQAAARLALTDPASAGLIRSRALRAEVDARAKLNSALDQTSLRSREVSAAQMRLAEVEARLARESAQAAESAAAAFRTEANALIQLAESGRATAQDLLRLVAIEDQLAAAAFRGTAAHRAETQALLEKVRAANLFNVAVPGALQQPIPALRPPPIVFPTIPLTGVSAIEQLNRALESGAISARTYVDVFVQLAGEITDISPVFAQAIASADDYAEALGRVADNLAAIGRSVEAGRLDALTPFLVQFRDFTRQFHEGLTTTLLLAGADAFLAFWDAVGAGEGVVQGFRAMIAGIARSLAQFFAAQAVGALAILLAPTPLVTPAQKAQAKAALPYLLAAAAAFAALGGATSGGRSGAGGSAPGREDVDRERFFRAEPRLAVRLQPSGRSTAAERASTVQPVQPVVVNVGPVIGVNDPQAQRDIAFMVGQAVNRGYAIGGR